MGLNRGIDFERQVRGWADAEGNAAVRKQCHHMIIFDGTYTIVDAICSQKFDGIANTFRPIRFAGMDRTLKPDATRLARRNALAKCQKTNMESSPISNGQSRLGAALDLIDQLRYGYIPIGDIVINSLDRQILPFRIRRHISDNSTIL